MRKKIAVILFVAVLSFGLLCGCQQEQDTGQLQQGADHEIETSVPGESQTGRDLNALNTSNITLKFNNFSEELARYYTTDLVFEESEISSAIAPEAVEYSDTAELEAARSDAIAFIQTTVPMYATFSDVTADIGDQGIQLHTSSDDYAKMYSVSMYLDGSVQLNYILQWSPSEEVNFDEAVTEMQLYTGIKITAEDLKALHNEILEAGNAGSYSFIMTDSLGMDGFYISVSDFNAAAETWQLYVQRYMTAE